MKDILEQFPTPKPATSTVATLLKRMQNKELVGYETFGNSREYYPVIQKKEYCKDEISTLVGKSFSNSFAQFASFFTDNSNLTKTELEKLRDLIDKKIDQL
jgi:predicted transcriptional regulator